MINNVVYLKTNALSTASERPELHIHVPVPVHWYLFVPIHSFYIHVGLINNSYNHHCQYSVLQVVLGIVQFIVVVIASIFIGIFFGCAGVLLTRISHHVHG